MNFLKNALVVIIIVLPFLEHTVKADRGIPSRLVQLAVVGTFAGP